jgi:hypothetical protein
VTNDDWGTLRRAWLAEKDDGTSLAAARARAARTRRLTNVARTAVAVLVLAEIAAATAHAANLLEGVLAVSVSIAIAVLWAQDAIASRRDALMLTSATAQYVTERATLLRSQIRTLWFVRVVLLLQLVFLVPWWIGGIRIHAAEAWSRLTVFALWLPLVGTSILLWWTRGRMSVARRELAALEHVTA